MNQTHSEIKKEEQKEIIQFEDALDTVASIAFAAGWMLFACKVANEIRKSWGEKA